MVMESLCACSSVCPPAYKYLFSIFAKRSPSVTDILNWKDVKWILDSVGTEWWRCYFGTKDTHTIASKCKNVQIIYFNILKVIMIQKYIILGKIVYNYASINMYPKIFAFRHSNYTK
jgi:hypothetical protein